MLLCLLDYHTLCILKARAVSATLQGILRASFFLVFVLPIRPVENFFLLSRLMGRPDPNLCSIQTSHSPGNPWSPSLSPGSLFLRVLAWPCPPTPSPKGFLCCCPLKASISLPCSTTPITSPAIGWQQLPSLHSPNCQVGPFTVPCLGSLSLGGFCLILQFKTTLASPGSVFLSSGGDSLH